MQRSKDLPLITIISGILFTSLVLLLLLIFRPVEGEEEVYWELYSKDWNTYFSQEEFQQIIEISKEESDKIAAEKAEAKSRNYAPPIKDIELSSSRFTKEEIEVNTLIYQIAQNALFNEKVINLSKYEYLDPLVLLAMSNVENGGIRGKSFKLLGSALPTIHLPNNRVEPELLKSFNINDAIDLDIKMAFNWDNNKYLGPLQLAPYYGGISNSQSEFLEMLIYPEGERKIIASNLSNTNLVNKKGYAQYASGEPGDRWNWNDACVRSVASWDEGFKSLNSNKRALITDKYMLVNILALNHNVGVSICVYDFNKASEGLIKYISEDKATIGDAWNFCIWLSSPQLITALSLMSEDYISKGDISHLPTKDEMTNLIVMYGNIMDQETLKRFQPFKGWETEPPMHALRVLYNYITLEKLFSGR